MMSDEPAQSSTLSNAAVEMLWRGDVIGAIKVVRVERNLGLKERLRIWSTPTSAPNHPCGRKWSRLKRRCGRS